MGELGLLVCLHILGQIFSPNFSILSCWSVLKLSWQKEWEHVFKVRVRVSVTLITSTVLCATTECQTLLKKLWDHHTGGAGHIGTRAGERQIGPNT